MQENGTDSKRGKTGGGTSTERFGFKAWRIIANKANFAILCIVSYPLDSIMSSLNNWTHDYLGEKVIWKSVSLYGKERLASQLMFQII